MKKYSLLNNEEFKQDLVARARNTFFQALIPALTVLLAALEANTGLNAVQTIIGVTAVPIVAALISVAQTVVRWSKEPEQDKEN